MFRILKNVVDEHQAKPPPGEGNSSKVTRNKQVLMFVFSTVCQGCPRYWNFWRGCCIGFNKLLKVLILCLGILNMMLMLVNYIFIMSSLMRQVLEMLIFLVIFEFIDPNLKALKEDVEKNIEGGFQLVGF